MSLLQKIETSLSEEVGEVNNLPSETIPGQSYSLKELLQRAMRGQEIPSYRDDYDDDPSLDRDPLNQNNLDLTDLQPMLSELHELQDKHAKEAALQQARELIAANELPSDPPAPDTPLQSTE